MSRQPLKSPVAPKKGNSASVVSSCEQVTLPAGAGSIDLMPRQVGSGLGTDFLQVQIGGNKWAAGVEPDRLQGWERELHKDYKSTDVYKALFYAALLISEQSVIDMLVTGLPVDQAMNDGQRKELAELLSGEHHITPKRTVFGDN